LAFFFYEEAHEEAAAAAKRTEKGKTTKCVTLTNKSPATTDGTQSLPGNQTTTAQKVQYQCWLLVSRRTQMLKVMRDT
jgi:hypothetical protein